MMQRKSAFELSDELMTAVTNSLPKRLCNRRLELLPRILQEWSRTDLPKLLSMELGAITLERIKKLENVKKSARQLLDALEQVGKPDRRRILVLMAVVAERRRWEDLSRAEWTSRTTRLDEEHNFLAKLSAIAPRASFKARQRGQPPNYRAYLFLQDAAAIFEWVTCTEATREVSRDDGTEISPFFRFASTLWVAVFGAAGLPAAMKNWASGRSQYDERSALVANIDLRHPTWGIFER
jgi:hypothetical protein